MKSSLELLRSSEPGVVHISRPSPLFSRLRRQNVEVLRLMLPRHLCSLQRSSMKHRAYKDIIIYNDIYSNTW